MVTQTVNQVQAILAERFHLSGDVLIDPATLVVDVHGGVRMISYAPEFGVQFGEVYGDFFCYNMTLKSLQGAPHRVGRDFNCEGNLLTSLEHAPTHVTGAFSCAYNARISSLMHAPAHVGDSFNCAQCELTSLEGAPEIILGWFDCRQNHLTSLQHAPRQVIGSLDCSDNPLTSMEGAPTTMGSIELSYDAQLPLLRCLHAQLDIHFMNGDSHAHKLENIMNRYLGSDRAGMLKCAVEMIKAGFKENARW
jgi:hypothetical protein